MIQRDAFHTQIIIIIFDALLGYPTHCQNVISNATSQAHAISILISWFFIYNGPCAVSKFNNNSKYHSDTKKKTKPNKLFDAFCDSACPSYKSRFPFSWLTTCAHSPIQARERGYVREENKKRLDITGRLCLAKEGGKHQETLTYCECTFYIVYHFRNMCCPFGNRISIWPRKGIEAISFLSMMIRTCTDGWNVWTQYVTYDCWKRWTAL